MKILICYDTRYGSTKKICQYIKMGMANNASIKNISDVSSFDYDLMIIGSPVFIGKPMKSVESFIINNYENFRSKKIAIFVTCWAMATKFGSSSVEFLEQLKKYLPPCNLICERALPGKLLLDKIHPKDQKTMKRLLRRLDSMSDQFNSQEIDWRDARDKHAALKFGKDIEEKLMYEL